MSITAFSEPGNNAESTLALSVAAADLTLTLIDGSPFPVPVNGYNVTIDDSEIVRVTSRSGNLCTVLRGREGTTAIDHASGATVRQLIGKDWITELQVATNALEAAIAVHDAAIAAVVAGSITAGTLDIAALKTAQVGSGGTSIASENTVSAAKNARP